MTSSKGLSLATNILALPQVLAWLELDDIAQVGKVCHSIRLAAARAFKVSLRAHGVTPLRKRLLYWASCAGVEELFSTYYPREEYSKCLGKRRGKDSLEIEGIEGEILRDVPRTYPDLPFFEGKGQDMLANVLRAVSIYVPGVNYCQGMNYVAAVLLLETGDEDQMRAYRRKSTFSHPNDDSDTLREVVVFAIMCGLVCSLDMRELWRPGVPQLKLRIFQFDRLLANHMPSTSNHFKSIGLSPDFFASQWFLTLLSYNVKPPHLQRIWDILLTDGWKTIFRVGIAILKSLDLKEKGLEELAKFFKQGRLFESSSTSPYKNVTDVLEIAMKIKGISTRTLIDFESQYVAHVLHQQLSDTPDVHGSAAFVDRRVASLVRQELIRLDGPVRSDVSALRGKIEQTDRALRDARFVFQCEAKEFVEVQADVEELQDAKRAIASQTRNLVLSADALESDFQSLHMKMGAVEAQLVKERERFAGVLWRTTQAQIDLEEQLERKRVFSEQLQLVVERNEVNRAQRMKTLFRELNQPPEVAPQPPENQ